MDSGKSYDDVRAIVLTLLQSLTVPDYRVDYLRNDDMAIYGAQCGEYSLHVVVFAHDSTALAITQYPEGASQDWLEFRHDIDDKCSATEELVQLIRAFNGLVELSAAPGDGA